MPTCPACGVSVGYDELRTHLGTCKFVWSEAPERTDRFTEQIASKVRRLEQRLQTEGASTEGSTVGDVDRTDANESDHRRHRLR